MTSFEWSPTASCKKLEPLCRLELPHRLKLFTRRCSAGSRDFLCKKLGLLTAKVVTDPLPDLLSSQNPSRFDNRSLAVDPFRLNLAELGTLGRQPAWDDAYTTFAGASLLQHGRIVLA